MQIELIFFDSQYNSGLGTKRALIALVPVTLLFLILTTFNKYNTISFWKNLLPIFLIISALGVQIPQSKSQSAVYGALVGFVIFGTIGSLYSTDFMDFLKTISLGTGVCSFSSFLIAAIS